MVIKPVVIEPVVIEPENRNESENDEPSRITGVEFEGNTGVLSKDISLEDKMNSTYGARIRTGMRTRSKKKVVPWKLRENSGKTKGDEDQSSNTTMK